MYVLRSIHPVRDDFRGHAHDPFPEFHHSHRVSSAPTHKAREATPGVSPRTVPALLAAATAAAGGGALVRWWLPEVR